MEQVCTCCGKLKRIESFGKNNQQKSGYEKVCKICRNHKAKTKRQLNPKPKSKRDGMRMSGLRKSDWCGLYKFLQEIGYDVNGDIHRQFVEKHDLVYKERHYKNRVAFYPKDCQDLNPDVQTD